MNGDLEDFARSRERGADVRVVGGRGTAGSSPRAAAFGGSSRGAVKGDWSTPQATMSRKSPNVRVEIEPLFDERVLDAHDHVVRDGAEPIAK